MRAARVVAAAGLVLVLAGVTLSQKKVRLELDKCCEPAVRVPPAGQCEVDCVPGVVLNCDPAPVVGCWQNGQCHPRRRDICGKTVTNRLKPIFQCIRMNCVVGGQPGTKCVWMHVNDMGPVQMAVNSCIGTNC